MRRFIYIAAMIGAAIGPGLTACAPTEPARKPTVSAKGSMITIDEEMYDAPSMAQTLCTSVGYGGATLVSRDAAAKKSTYECTN